jgi:hypothetical protein
MTRIALGVALTLAAQLIGWPRIEAAAKAAQRYTQAAYTAAEKAVQASEAGK